MKKRFLPISMRFIPKAWRKNIRNIEMSLLLINPLLAHNLMKILYFLIPQSIDRSDDFYALIKDTNLVITSGGGNITDISYQNATETLCTIRLAQQLRKKTAMFGEGLGPLSDPKIIRLTKKVFPKLLALGVREGLTSPNLARKSGIRNERLFITGDDAIEFALNEDSISTRECIGVNIRQALYAGNIFDKVYEIPRVVTKITKAHGIPIVPIPITKEKPISDLESIDKLFELDEVEYQLAQEIDSVYDLLRQIKRCRLVITGSYHAGVFALACGVPVVCLSGTRYYDLKFEGLSGQFGVGCHIVDYRSETFPDELYLAIQKLLNFHEDESAYLIKKANEQRDCSIAAWDFFLRQ
jgi:colanic acid/amylovoran biosynthesis protein